MVIRGGRPIHGEVGISGGKNAVGAILPATLLVDGVCRIENIPQISDVSLLLTNMHIMGAGVNTVNKSTAVIDSRRLDYHEGDQELMSRIRATYYFVGVMLGRFGKARVSMPGGCDLGVRPIDQHLKGLRALGADVEVENGLICAEVKGGRLRGASIYLDVVSVGATINIMLAAVKARGRTVIENAAREPHVVDLANFLNSMGADIRGAGTSVIRIYGVEKLSGGTYTIIPDQIEAGTFLTAATATGGEVLVKNVIPKHLLSITAKLEEMGAEIEDLGDAVLVRRTGKLYPCNLKTMPYPGFPTDMLPQLTTCLSIAEGTSIVTETVSDNRYKFIGELSRMGADIQVDGKTAVVKGVEKLSGSRVKACDLRAGAAMVIAGLCAKGITRIGDVYHIERGYEDMCGKLRSLGADIAMIEDTTPEETPEKAMA
jgi:UDP-N-acetylglucosamine 1-carboxyvinyltransferase